MQRENAAHLPAVPANDTRDTPLNRLLRKPGPAPEAPLAPEMPVSKPLVAQVTVPESVVAKPQAAQISPGEMLVNKLQGKQMSPRSTSAVPPKQVPVAEPIVDKPIDVDYTPVDPPASEPVRAADTGVETPVHKPLPMLNTGTGTIRCPTATDH